MWFRFPRGCERVSVERQEFASEATDGEGWHYFRAPDHFAPRLLNIGGFAAVTEPPPGAPEDLPKADPLRDSAIAELTATVEALKVEVQNLRSDLISAAGQNTALENEKKALAAELDKAKDHIAALEEQLEDAPAKVAKK